MSAIRALKAGESGGEVTATEEGLDGGDGGGTQRAEGLPVVFFVGSEEGCEFNYAIADDQVTITGYTGSGGDVTIPDPAKRISRRQCREHRTLHVQ